MFPDAGWGLHLTDGNTALGDLVDEVAAQKATYLGPPRLRLRLDAAFGRDARGRRSPAGCACARDRATSPAAALSVEVAPRIRSHG